MTSAVPHIGIIGAGIAGLRCADVLLQRGFRVTILEARSRIGGRVYQKELGTHLVDMGPNWIHGTDSNPIAEISKATDTITHEFEGPHRVVGRDGKTLSMAATDRVSNVLWTLVDETLDWSLQNSSTIPAELNAFDHLKKKIEESDLSTTEKECCVELSKLWGSYIGSPIDRQSLKYFFMEAGIEGSNLFVGSTYGKILRHISKSVQANAQVIFNEKVVSVSTKHQGGVRKSVVTTTLDKQYEFDEVVATLPLGYLKTNKSMFSPPLPPKIVEAIDKLGYGALEKIYVHFPSAFWHIKKEDATADEANQKHPIEFVDFLNPSYATMPAQSEFWNQECISLSSLPSPCQQPTLLFYLHGPSAEYITLSIATLDPNSEEYFRVVNTFIKPFYAKLPRYDEKNPACHPSAVLATQWSNDEFSGHGSYTNFQAGLEGGMEHVNAFSDDELSTARGVWFAGEHSAPLLGLGTTAGAYWSGENTAKRICKYLEQN